LGPSVTFLAVFEVFSRLSCNEINEITTKYLTLTHEGCSVWGMKYFVSYAHADQEDVDRFFEVMRPLLAAAAGYTFERWMDTDILPGEKWHDEIQAAVRECDFGLLLVSPAFLASKYISEHELAAMLAKPMVVPVALHPIRFDGSMDLKGLGERQIFRDAQGRTFDQCGRKHTRRAFALELFQKINALLKKGA